MNTEHNNTSQHAYHTHLGKSTTTGLNQSAAQKSVLSFRCRFYRLILSAHLFPCTPRHNTSARAPTGLSLQKNQGFCLLTAQMVVSQPTATHFIGIVLNLWRLYRQWRNNCVYIYRSETIPLKSIYVIQSCNDNIWSYCWQVTCIRHQNQLSKNCASLNNLSHLSQEVTVKCLTFKSMGVEAMNGCRDYVFNNGCRWYHYLSRCFREFLAFIPESICLSGRT